MFFSLNKKIFYIISIFFIIASIIFILSFYIVYGGKIQEDQRAVFRRNQQYLQLLSENIYLRKQNFRLSQLENAQIEKREHELNLEKRLAKENQYSYNQRYETISNGIKIIALSGISFIFLLILISLWSRKHILKPINKISEIARYISSGDLSLRIPTKINPRTKDELDYLADSFNLMIDNIEKNIETIKERDEFLQSLVNGIPDGICVIDKSGKILIANDEYYKQCNKKRSLLKEKHKYCYYLNYQSEIPCPNKENCPITAIFNRNEKSFKSVHEFNQTTGKQLFINAAPLKIKTNNENKEYIIMSIRDLSEDIKFSHQQKISSLLFISTSLAHEIKNNLGSTRMILEHLLEKFYENKSKDNEEKKYLSMILKQIVECSNVPERLLKLTKNTSDSNETFTIQESVNEIIRLLDYEATHAGIEIKVNIPQHPIAIQGNETDFKMALLNLIQNAFHALEKTQHPEVIINVKSDKNKIKINIEDNGSGISPQDMPHIFEPFFTHNGSTPTKGSGLGLPIVKSIITSFKGKIEAKSIPNKKTTFTLTFPYHNE